MAAAVLTAGHLQRAGSRNREGRHHDRRGHGAHRGSASPQLSNLGMAKRSESLRGGELMGYYCYTYLRAESDSRGPAGSPFYIGEGTEGTNRIESPRGLHPTGHHLHQDRQRSRLCDRVLESRRLITMHPHPAGQRQAQAMKSVI